jgi:hypothetical protein
LALSAPRAFYAFCPKLWAAVSFSKLREAQGKAPKNKKIKKQKTK